MKLERIILEEYNKSFLSDDEERIVNDILSVNEGNNNIINKIKNYGRKGLLTLGILLTVAGSIEAQGGDGIELIQNNIEYVDNNEKRNFYSILVGMTTDLLHDAFKRRNIENAGALKELRIYYVNLRDNKQPFKLSEQAKKAEESLKRSIDASDFSKNTIDYYHKLGKNLQLGEFGGNR